MLIYRFKPPQVNSTTALTRCENSLETSKLDRSIALDPLYTLSLTSFLALCKRKFSNTQSHLVVKETVRVCNQKQNQLREKQHRQEITRLTWYNVLQWKQKPHSRNKFFKLQTRKITSAYYIPCFSAPGLNLKYRIRIASDAMGTKMSVPTTNSSGSLANGSPVYARRTTGKQATKVCVHGLRM